MKVEHVKGGGVRVQQGLYSLLSSKVLTFDICVQEVDHSNAALLPPCYAL